MQEQEITGKGIRFSIERDGTEAARVYLYILNNSLHSEPFGLVEDLFVDEKYRSQGLARELVQAVIAKAKDLACYKLLATSRNDGTREAIHAWYGRLGFKDHGIEFRMNL